MKNFLRKTITIIIVFFMIFSSGGLAFSNSVAYAEDAVSNGIVSENVGETYYGFQLKSIKELPKYDSKILIFTHVKTGAQLMYIKNNDTQRAFDITFRTPTSDNTGVNHIIEHSVLDGSKNYPVKSPFQEMLKGSLGSFINAMTTNDYTTFPVATTNEQDLQNLMGVYLDAVFYPNIVKNENIFKQEGWRYELPSKDSQLSINGVVYNEMKGNYSDPEWILHNAVYQSLFPDTSYKWDAGGNPENIPSLTRQQLVAVYNKNYTPSNSYIYLYGKLDISKYLKFVDENYLSKFDKSNVDTSIKYQNILSNISDKTVMYPVSKDSDTKRKTYLSLNFVTGSVDDRETNLAMSFLSYLLMGMDNAPLKKALVEKGIADNVSSSFSMEGIQPVFSITAANSEESSKKIFENTVFDTLKDISKNGFDPEFLKSALASYEISSRSEKLVTPIMGGTGLVLLQTALATWIYDKDPTMYFDTDDVMKKINGLDQNEYFRNIINKYLLSNPHHSMVILKPEAGLESENEQNTIRKLANYKNSIGEAAVNSLVGNTQNFNIWQKEEDPKEEIEKLPKLSVDDIKPELPNLNYRVEKKGGMNVLTHNANLNGLSAISFYFDTSRVPQEKLKYLSLLSTLLGNVNTKEHSEGELSNDMLKQIGSPISFSASAIASNNNDDNYKPKMTMTILAPEENIAGSMKIATEIINDSEFNDRKKIKQVIDENKAALQSLFSSGSGSVAIMAMNSYMSESGKYSEEITGIPYYRFLQDLSDNFDSRWNDISKNLKEVSKLALNRNNLLVTYSGSEEGAKVLKGELETIGPKLNSQKLSKQKYSFEESNKNIAFSSSSKVQTVLQGGNFKKTEYAYSGKMMVLQNILNMGYLWNKVRTTGGAYGVQASFSPGGEVLFASMRDPKLRETLNAFEGAVDYLKNFQATEGEMTDYIIGAVRDFVNLKTNGPLIESALCDSMYLKDFSQNDILKYEKEALSTTPEDIRNYGNMLDKVLKQNIYFVEGSRDKIDGNKDLFNDILDTEK
ncbi:insulinase family protein [Clostridium sp. LBM24168]